MNTAGLVARGRIAARRLMLDTCTITRATTPVFNSTTGAYTTSSTSIYSGPCRVRTPSVAGITITDAQAGDAEQHTVRPVLVLPHGEAADAEAGDVVTMTGGDLSGQTFTVVSSVDSTTMTARALVIEAVRG